MAKIQAPVTLLAKWRRRYLVRAFFVLLLSQAVSAHGSEAIVLRYVISDSNNWAPYRISSRENPGVLGELVPAILRTANMKGLPAQLPPQRTLKALEKGQLDFDIISPAWFAENEIQGDFLLSDPILPLREHIVSMPGEWKAGDDYRGRAVATVLGYFYHDDHSFTRQDYPSEREVVMAVANGRIDIGILGDLPALYWASKLNLKIELNTLHAEGALHIRLRKELAPILPQINTAIATLKANGKTDEIIQKYIHDIHN